VSESPLLLRQIHPNFVQEDGHVMYVAFRPTSKDGKRLSVSDGSKISPEDAWKRYTTILRLASRGVLCVTLSECQSISLPVLEDALDDQPDHMLIDFSHLEGNRKIDGSAKTLRNFASNRGWLYFANE